MFLLILFFLWPMNVAAEMIETPYLYVGNVEQSYHPNENEQIKIKKKYRLEEINPKMTEHYYFEGSQPDGYEIRTNDYQYTKWSSWQDKKLEGLEEEQKTIYYYQELRKINQLIFYEDDMVHIMNISIKHRYTQKLIATWKRSNIIVNEPIHITLDKNYSPEDIVVEINTFLWQEANTGTIIMEDNTADYIKMDFSVSQKGISNHRFLLINCLQKMQWEKEVLTGDQLEDKFYYRLLKEERKYRYRLKLYRYQKKATIILSDRLKDGYQIKETYFIYELYRKENILLWDEIRLTEYVDIDKVIKKSTIALKNINMHLVSACGKTTLQLSYQDFMYEKEVMVECLDPPKSRIIRGKSFSFLKCFIATLLKMSIKKRF